MTARQVVSVPARFQVLPRKVCPEDSSVQQQSAAADYSAATGYSAAADYGVRMFFRFSRLALLLAGRLPWLAFLISR